MAFCGQCGATVTDGHTFCSGCGARAGSPSNAPSSATAAAPALEKTFHQDARVVVTNSRCIVDGQTYAMSGVTSVRSFVEVPSKKGPILLIIIGALFTLGSLSHLPDAIIGLVIGIGLVAAGIAWFKSKKDIFHAVVHSASGESRLVHSIDQSYIAKIIAALNEAIVYRR